MLSIVIKFMETQKYQNCINNIRKCKKKLTEKMFSFSF